MPEVTPQSIVFGLPMLQWRGLDAPPYDIAPFQVRHNQSKRPYPFVEGVGHDNTGRDAIPMTTRLYFFNTLQPQAFPGLYEQWKVALMDGSAGDMRHPLLGPIRARVLDWGVVLDANVSLAGVLVNVTWEDTLDDPARVTQFHPLTNNITALARQVDNNLKKVKAKYPGTDVGEPLADPLQQIEGALFSASLTFTGAINQVSGQIDGLIEIVDSLDDATIFAVKDNLTLLANSVMDLQETQGLGQSRATAEVVYQFPQTMDAVARDVGNTTQEIMELNVGLLRTPQIPPKTAIVYFTE